MNDEHFTVEVTTDLCPNCGHPYDPHLMWWPTPEQVVALIIPGFTQHAIDFAVSDPEYAANARHAAERFGDGTAVMYSECPVEDCRCLITYEFGFDA